MTADGVTRVGSNAPEGDPWIEHRRARHIVNLARRRLERAVDPAIDAPPVALEELAGLVIVNARPEGMGRARWAVRVARMAYTGKRPRR